MKSMLLLHFHKIQTGLFLTRIHITDVATGWHRRAVPPNENCCNSLPPPLPVALVTIIQSDILESLLHRKVMFLIKMIDKAISMKNS